jgi:hypothetical protein
MKITSLVAVFLSTALQLSWVSAESPGILGGQMGPLSGLDRLQEGRSMRSSSSDIWDWRNGNSDARPIAPGQTLVIADLAGPGRIDHIWNTIASKDPKVSRAIVIRMYWDGEEHPSVEAPLGDFFVIGHGDDRSMQSLPVTVSAEGRARNCYWPMPFRKGAKITVTNEGDKPVDAFYYYVDWRKLPLLSEDTPYFHAQYRQNYPTTDENHQIADIEGRGHYVGTVINVRQRTGGWFGEGDDFFYIDGEKEPSIRGTGTEDYFCDAWGFREFNSPFYGVPIFDHYQQFGRITAYRWHLTDPIVFDKSLRMEIEHKGAVFNDKGEVATGYGPRTEDYASVAYWYQLEPHKPFAKFPSAAERLYPEVQSVIEAESVKAKTTSGDFESQAGEHFSHGAQLFWRPMSEGQSIELPFNVAKAGKYDLRLTTTHARDYGVYDVLVDGQVILPKLDLYAAEQSRLPHVAKAVELAAGDHTLKFKNVGKTDASTGYFLGVDVMELNAVE